MLDKIGLGKYKELLDTSFSDNERAFQAVIPQTKKDVEKFNYEVGGHVMLEMYPIDGGENDGGK